MKIPLSALAVHKCSSEDGPRYLIGSIQVANASDGQPVAIGTDGMRLLILGWSREERDDALPNPVLIDRDSCRLLLYSCTKSKDALGNPKEAVLVTKEDTSELSVVNSGCGRRLMVEARRYDGRFPDWRKIDIEPADGDVSVRVNPRFLGEMLLAIADHLEQDYPQVTLTVRSASSLITVDAVADTRRAAGHVMPLDPDRVSPKRQWVMAAPKEPPAPEPKAKPKKSRRKEPVA